MLHLSQLARYPVLAQTVPAISGWQIVGAVAAGVVLDLFRRRADALEKRLDAIEKRCDDNRREIHAAIERLDREATDSRHDIRDELTEITTKQAVLDRDIAHLKQRRGAA